jgi:hypothetical protein
MHWLLAVTLPIYGIVLQNSQIFSLKRFSVIRVNPDDVGRLPESLRIIFVDPALGGEPIGNLEEAAKRIGFMPRLLNGKTPRRFFITNSVNEEARISVTALTAALQEAKVANIVVPADWDGVIIRLEQRRGIVADYGDFYIAEGGLSTLSAPSGVPVPQVMEVLFRVLGMSATDARGLREQFSANATAFVPIPKRYDMDIRQVPMPSGPGLLLQNADKGGELAFMWSIGDRSYFLTGLLTEEQAIAAANSFQ